MTAGRSAMAFLDRKGAERTIRRATEHGFFDAREHSAGLRADPADRRHLEHRRAQLPARQAATGDGVALLGRRPDQHGHEVRRPDDAGRAGEQPDPPRRADRRRRPDRPVPDHRRHLRTGRLHRPHLTMAGLLSDHRHDRRRRDVRPREGRPRGCDSQGTGQPAGQLPHRSDPGLRSRRVARELRRQQGQLVGTLERTARSRSAPRTRSLRLRASATMPIHLLATRRVST